jgi:predicted DNA-binding transcriptional regulator AlpA
MRARCRLCSTEAWSPAAVPWPPMLKPLSVACLLLLARRSNWRHDVSDRQKYHLDKRAQTIIEMLVRKEKDRKPISKDQMRNTRQVAVLFGVSEVWLEILRQKKQGPKYVVLGPRCVRYKVGDLLAWLEVRARGAA